MTEMVERAAKAVMEAMRGGEVESYDDEIYYRYEAHERMAKAALVAALDPTDEALRNILASYIKDHAPFGSIDSHQARECATKTITLLQKRVARSSTGQGETAT
jgi:hypothetical protein